jgi:hypothetical protein
MLIINIPVILLTVIATSYNIIQVVMSLIVLYGERSCPMASQ